jgi:hypothetical protein
MLKRTAALIKRVNAKICLGDCFCLQDDPKGNQPNENEITKDSFLFAD